MFKIQEQNMKLREKKKGSLIVKAINMVRLKDEPLWRNSQKDNL